MNFWSIFLCLLAGAAVGYCFGYESGKVYTIRKVRNVVDELKKQVDKIVRDMAEKAKEKEAEEKYKQASEALKKYCRDKGDVIE